MMGFASLMSSIRCRLDGLRGWRGDRVAGVIRCQCQPCRKAQIYFDIQVPTQKPFGHHQHIMTVPIITINMLIITLLIIIIIIIIIIISISINPHLYLLKGWYHQPLILYQRDSCLGTEE